jgi:hypothetical protein
VSIFCGDKDGRCGRAKGLAKTLFSLLGEGGQILLSERRGGSLELKAKTLMSAVSSNNANGVALPVALKSKQLDTSHSTLSSSSAGLFSQ